MTAEADRIRSHRQRLAAPGGAHDRLIRLLAVALPAAVGVIAALMIVTPLAPRGEISFLLDRNEVAIAEDRLRVDQALYRGQDDSGRPFSVNAGEAVQRSVNDTFVSLNDLRARILLRDGPAMLEAAGARYDLDDELIAIPGVVRFKAADGYSMIARGVRINLPAQTITGTGGIEGTVPAGTFRADSIRADLDERIITLDGNARMRMVPGALNEVRMPR